MSATPVNIRAACRAHGIDRSAVYKRMRAGMGFAEAMAEAVACSRGPYRRDRQPDVHHSEPSTINGLLRMWRRP